MKKTVYTAIIILLLLVNNGCKRGSDKNDYSSFDKGVSNFNRGKYVEAKTDLNKFLSQYPETDFTERAQYYLGRCEKLIRKKELGKIRQFFAIQEQKTFIRALAFSSQNNRLVLATNNKEFRFFDTLFNPFQANIVEDEKQEVRQEQSSAEAIWGPGYRFSVYFQEGEVASLAFSPDGKYLVAGFINGTVGIWQAPKYKIIKSEKVHEKKVISITFSPDNRWMITASEDGLLNIWDLSGVPVVYQNRKIENSVDAVVSCPDNSTDTNYLAVAGDHCILVGSLQAENSGKGEIEFRVHAVLPNKSGERIKKLSFTSGCKSLASLHENNMVRIWDLGKIKSVLAQHDLLDKHLTWPLAESDWKTSASYWQVGWKFLEHSIQYKKSAISSMVLGYFGEFLITSHMDKSIIVWDVKKEQIMRILPRSRAPIDYLILSPDSRVMVTASTYKDIFLWNVNVDWKAIF